MDISTQTMETPVNRGHFLRRLGLALGAGIGVVALTPGVAKASNNCCLNNTQCTGSCPSGQFWFFCNCDGIGSSYCICHAGTSCYSGPC